MSTTDWLLVGAGDIARKRVASALAGARGSRLVGVCDAVEANAGALASEHGLPEVYLGLDEALARTSANAVYVATPVGLHVPHALKALASGRHVLVEKPLGLDGTDGTRAVEAAAKGDRLAGCSYFRRLFPAYRHAREMLERGEFGRVVLVRMAYFSWFCPAPDDPKYWRVVRAKSGGGPLSDMGTHMFDLLIGLFGMPERVSARCDNLVHQWDVEDTASVLMRLPGGAQATASFAWNSRTWRHEFEIVGTEAKVYWHPYDAGQVVKTVGRQVETLELKPAENVHLPLVQDFVDAVRDGRPPVCPLSEAVKTNLLLDAIYRSAEEGREMRTP